MLYLVRSILGINKFLQMIIDNCDYNMLGIDVYFMIFCTTLSTEPLSKRSERLAHVMHDLKEFGERELH